MKNSWTSFLESIWCVETWMGNLPNEKYNSLGAMVKKPLFSNFHTHESLWWDRVTLGMRWVRDADSEISSSLRFLLNFSDQAAFPSFQTSAIEASLEFAMSKSFGKIRFRGLSPGQASGQKAIIHPSEACSVHYWEWGLYDIKCISKGSWMILCGFLQALNENSGSQTWLLWLSSIENPFGCHSTKSILQEELYFAVWCL